MSERESENFSARRDRKLSTVKVEESTE